MVTCAGAAAEPHLFCFFMHTTKEHEQHSTLDVIMSIDLRCNALGQVPVNVRIGLHLINLSLLILCVVIIHFFWCFIFGCSDVGCSTTLICRLQLAGAKCDQIGEGKRVAFA